MESSQSNKKRRVTRSTTTTNTQPESHDMLRSVASENSPERILSSDKEMEEDSDKEMEENPTTTIPQNAPLGEEDGEAAAADDIATRVYIKLTGKKAEYWNHYKGYMTKSDKIRVECLYCKTTYAAHGKHNGTTNLAKHVKNCTQNPANKSKGTQSKLVLEKLDENEHWKIKNWVLDLVEVRKSLIRLIVGEELPFRFVEKPFFKEFIASMCPTFKIPSRWTIARDCYQLFLDEQLKLKDYLLKNCQRVSVTTDTWTSLQKVNYMSLTAHFVDVDWNIQRRILNFCPISGHKGDDIARDVEGCLRPWGLCGKIYTVTVDNASANNSACKDLKDIVKATGKSICGAKYLHMRCTAHICNRIVQAGLNVHIACVDKVRAVVKFIRSSPARLNQFKVEVKNSEVESTSSLVLDVPTRWNSTYKMLEVALKYRRVFNRLDTPRDSEGVYLGHITAEEWAKVEVIVNFLKHFYDFTNLISGTSYVTVSNVFCYISEIMSLLNQWEENIDSGCRLMAVPMKEKCEKYWGDLEKMNMFMFVAIILDPQYKFEGLQIVLTECYGDEKGEEYAEIVKVVTKKLFDEYVTIYAPKASSKPQSQTSTMGGLVAQSTGTSFGGGLLKSLSSKLDKLNESNGALYTNEFDRYLHDLRCQDISALTWWKFNGNRFPILARLARDVLAIPVTTVASESAFSTGGRTLDQFRSSLAPKTAEALICTQDWLRATGRVHESTYDEVVELFHESEQMVEGVQNTIQSNP